MQERQRMEETKTKRWENWIGIVILAIGAGILAAALYVVGFQPSGGDMWGHLYKSQTLYEQLQTGNLYPLLDLRWYNGIQLFRYWGPFSYYIMSGMLFLSQGNIVHAYYLFAAFVFFFGGLPWVLWGNYMNRRVLGTVFGVLWFFMPETIRIYFCAGNLPQMTTTTMVPYLIFFLWLFVRKEKNKAAIGLYIGMFLMTITHLMVTALMGLSAFLFLAIDEIRNKAFRRKFLALCVMVTGIVTAGIWVLPSLKGGMVTTEQSGDSVMSTLIYPLTTSLNPFNRVWGERDSFYFGLGIVILCVLGILLARGYKKAGFIFALIILVFTTPATYPILSKLPFSQLFWMTRFTPMVYGFFFCSMLEWERLKKKYCVVAMAILVLDLIPSFAVTQFGVITPDDTIADITKLRDMTSQRAAVMDISSYGSYPSYGVCAGKDGVSYTYGWSWQGANTGDNIVLLNEALEKENYLYLFDRCLELGNDTVLIRKIYVGKNGGSEEDMLQAASRVGYKLQEETTGAYLFKKETPEQFGVVSTYTGCVIGKYANAMTTLYPCFEVGHSEQLDDYTVEELSQYEVIFLTGFTYKDKEAAEELIRRLDAKGIRVVIDSTHIPSDERTKQQTFLEISNQPIHFTKRYPALQWNGQKVQTGAFSGEDTEFNTGYISSIDHVTGTFEMGDRELTFLGYKEDLPNVQFLGLNLMYYAEETRDRNVINLLNDVLQVSDEQLPKREYVPIQMVFTGNILTIASPKDNVNTTIAYQDTFDSEQEISDRNQLLVVEKGITTITMEYPLLKPGLIVSLTGVAAFVLCLFILYGGYDAVRRKWRSVS